MFLEALLLGSAATSLIGSFMEADARSDEIEAQNKANEYNAQTLESNAKLSEKYAKQTVADASAGIATIKRKTAEIRSSQAAGYASSGVVTTSGSAAAVSAGSQYIGDVDAMTYRRNAVKESEKYLDQASQYRQQAKLTRMGYRDPDSGTAPILLSGITSAASKAGTVIANKYGL